MENNSEIKNKYKGNFILSCLDNGWTVKKKNNKYIFIKKHNGKKEIFSDSFLQLFMEENFGIKNN